MVCDLAQYYHVLDWRSLPLAVVGTLVQGLPMESRTMRALTGTKHDDKEILLAMITDSIRHLCWMISEDGSNGKNHPASIFDLLVGETPKETGFDSGIEFDAAWSAIIGGEADG